ncbi:hypothetical protein SS1G_03681 [Sclerotinia sclerotiorum 1980 UF-70]|uniref:Pyrroline-5-carboxylate reductase n=2 Tax=Sclerotinia sclerotiorum (strain ATCC 18683 / 1980 / Ss-1) TaxID=665079 RepID=A0A1D9QCJ7_SCLS1|nr:hypothetical protein SS1G_03681 [Sclerotinia sclerotiorum 1980 UF-70]APA12666.1 hypothetical protein sscle_09g074360 [Sclerotinia sclerotiorum 1980 UF-70]EDO01207.1 hypothetical protein SS1G_03681 [Sclerotinia sclerotiorum 1980 UF-70]
MAGKNGNSNISSDPTANSALGNIEKWIQTRDLTKGSNLVAAVVGCGNMGSAILTGILAANSLPGARDNTPISHIIACTKSEASASKVYQASKDCEAGDRIAVFYDDNLKAFQLADVIILACKPYMAEEVLGAPGVGDALANKLIISVLAGSTTEQLKEFAFNGSSDTKGCSFVRSMPNLGAQIKESSTVISTGSETISSKHEKAMEWIFQSIGQYTYVPDNVFQVAGVLAGCTPAWFLTAFDGILDGAVSEGMKRDTAKEILAGSMLAAAKLIQNGEHPAVLREKVSSPKGTTIQGLKTIEKGGVRSTYCDATIDSVQHGLNMSKK